MVVISGSRPDREGRHGHARLRRDVLERPVSVVPENVISARRRDEQILVVIVIHIDKICAPRETGLNPGLRGRSIFPRAVAIGKIKPVPSRIGFDRRRISVRDINIPVAVQIHIRDIDPHAGTRVVTNAGHGAGNFTKRPVAIIEIDQIEMIG